MIVTEL